MKKTMKELAKEMVEYWNTFVVEYIWVYNAINAYCYKFNIDLTDDEIEEICDIVMEM